MFKYKCFICGKIPQLYDAVHEIGYVVKGKGEEKRRIELKKPRYMCHECATKRTNCLTPE